MSKSLPISVGWFSIGASAAYASVSPRTVREWLRVGLRHSRLSSRLILIEKESLDEFLRKFEVREDEIEQTVDEVMEGFTP
jgi:hypothetical protein